MNGSYLDRYKDALRQNVSVNELKTKNPFLTVLDIDASNSMAFYSDSQTGIMSECLRNFQKEIINSEQADKILLAKVIFDDNVDISGFVKPENFDCTYNTGYFTALNDSIIASRKLILDYMEQVYNNGGTPQGCLIILSAGVDCGSKAIATDDEAREAICSLQRQDIPVAFIAFGNSAYGIAQRLGVDPRNIWKCHKDVYELCMVLNMISKTVIFASEWANFGKMNFFNF